MNVLSLFDGMSCGQIALNKLGFKVDNYFASEIDKYAIKVTQANYPDTIQLGDVKEVFGYELPKIDLLIGGSPCQGFSFAGKQLNFDDPRSKLFFEYVRLLEETKPTYFLLENVKMKKESQDVISKYLGVEPIEINSALVSAQNRKRLYWTNISGVAQPEDKGIILKDILQPENEIDEKYYLSEKALLRIKRKKYSKPQIEPDKTGALNTKNNSGQLSFDSGTTLLRGLDVNEKAPTQRSSTGRCLDNKHNYQIIKLNKQLNQKQAQNKSSCSTGGGNSGGNHFDMDIICVSMVGRKTDENGTRKDYDPNLKAVQRLEQWQDNKTNCLTSVQKDNLILQRPRGFNKGGEFKEKSPTLLSNSWEHNNHISNGYNLRRLTPLECERLQTVPDNHTNHVSNTQRYKMLGNGWTVDIIAHILYNIIFT